MNKVIKIVNIDGACYRVETSDTSATACGECAFYSGTCPKDRTGKALCWEYGEDEYFVEEPTKPRVEEFKEAAGITAEQTFTESQVKAAYADWRYNSIDEAEIFVAYMKKFSDPEYQEFLRLKAKFE